MKDTIALAAEQLTFVKTRAGQVDRQLKEKFDKSYAAWKATWDNPLIAISSAPITRAQTVEFLDLISLGHDIVPLLMEKLTDPDEFFALVAVDRLSRPELQITREIDDDAVLLGEQGRAIETVQRWAQAEA